MAAGSSGGAPPFFGIPRRQANRLSDRGAVERRQALSTARDRRSAGKRGAQEAGTVSVRDRTGNGRSPGQHAFLAR